MPGEPTQLTPTLTNGLNILSPSWQPAGTRTFDPAQASGNSQLCSQKAHHPAQLLWVPALGKVSRGHLSLLGLQLTNLGIKLVFGIGVIPQYTYPAQILQKSHILFIYLYDYHRRDHYLCVVK